MAKSASKRKPAPSESKPKRKIVRQLRNGQITIPKEFREELGIEPDDLLEVTIQGHGLELRPLNATKGGGSEWAVKLYEAFAPVRESLSDLSEEEINRAIDEALEEVRSTRRKAAS